MVNDDLILWIGRQLEQYGNTHRTLNSKSVKKMDFVYDALKALVKGDDLTVRKEINGDLYIHGVIHMNGKNIVIENPKLFAQVAELVSIFDFCPKLDGSIDLDFAFNDLIKD
jgi:hypothetical protein